MDIKYIWIKNYKNLQNIDFNFKHAGSEEFQFKNGKLNIKKNQSKKPKAFFSENIKGLTAIVGKNGSGKTNLIEFLNFNLSHATNGHLSTYRKDQGQGIIVLDNKIFVPVDIVIKNSEELKIKGYEILKFDKAPLDITQREMSWHEMEKNKYIYYNPNLDFRFSPMHSGSDNIVNISTSYLVNNDIYNSFKHEKSHKLGSEKTDSLLAYYRNEKLRESDVILNYQPINDLIELPSKIKLSIDHETENQLLKSKITYGDDLDEEEKARNRNYSELNGLDFGQNSLQDFLMEQEEETAYDLYNIPPKNKKESFEKSFLISFFEVYIFLNKKSFPDDFLRRFIFDLDFEIKDKELIRDLKQLKNSLNKVLELVNWTKDEFQITKAKYSTYNERELKERNIYRNIEIKLDSKLDRKAIKELIKITKKLLKDQLNFHYEIPHELSSGEQNLLNFYARFYWAKNEIIQQELGDYGIKGERVVIFIDEGEIALHPEWQRKFFKLATQFLSQLFKDRGIQLILTTHSPFVLSDIPKENVIFMKRNKKTGNAEIADLGREKTFGANIYSLLSDSFFMENGTIGEFAKEKIEWVIEALDNTDSDLTEDDITKIDYIINAIGEPLIKMQLEAMRNKRLNLSEVSIMRKRIEELEKEIEKQNDQDKEE
jgi:predicted ATP-dependent endonuclease of OLD family